jgi:hypothetical protein
MLNPRFILAAFIVAVFTSYVVAPAIFKPLNTIAQKITPTDRITLAENAALGVIPQ